MTPPTEEASDFYELVGKTCALLLDRKTEEALDALDSLQRKRPDAPEILYLMGIAAATMDEFGRALMLLEEAHNLDPECFEYSEALANLHVRVGNLAEGVYFAKLSTTLEPHPYVRNLIPNDLSNFFTSLENVAIPRHLAFGFVALNRHEYTEAVRELDRHLLLSPDDAQALTMVSRAHEMVGDYESAVRSIQKAVDLAPDDTACHFQAGRLSRAIGAEAPAEFHFTQIADLEKKDIKLVAASLALAQSMSPPDPQVIGKIKAAQEKLVKALPGLPPEADPSRTRKDKIHIGYVCNDVWHLDSVALLEPFLELHDRARFDITIYQQTQGRSAYIQHTNNLAESERRLWELGDEMASIIISGDEIDILVNMCSPAPDNRAELFAVSPAVIQVGYVGMNFGLNMPGITHVLSDPMTETAIRAQLGDDQKTEVVRPGLWSIKTPYLLPEVSPLPAKTAGVLTLGAHCDLSTLTAGAVEVLSETLQSTPGSRLLLGASGRSDAFVRNRVAEIFAKHGVSERVSVWEHKASGDPWLPDANYWHNIDLFLAINGLSQPLRAADALWMGVPVLALKDDTQLNSCTAASILASATRLEWTFDQSANMIDQIKKFAADVDALAELRAGLRQEVRKTALFNPLLHVREVEEIFTKLIEARDSNADNA
ncbi:MAG: tetratricopeptide repeat protein [Alphaproteobacteria bacterium]